MQLDAAHPALAWVTECFSDRSPRKVVGDVVVDRGYPFVLLVDLSSHKVTKTNEVELVEHFRRSAAVLGDTLCGRVVNKRRSMSKVLSELDSEVEKDFAADIASVRLKDVDREILDLCARPPPMNIVEGVVERAPGTGAAVILSQVELPRSVRVPDQVSRGTDAGKLGSASQGKTGEIGRLELMLPPDELLADLGGDHHAEELALVDSEKNLLRGVDGLAQVEEMRSTERDNVRCVQELVNQRMGLIELGDADSVRHDPFRLECALHDGGVRLSLDLRKQSALNVEMQADAEEDDTFARAVLFILGALVQQMQSNLDRGLGVELDARLVMADRHTGGVGDERDLGRPGRVIKFVVEGEQATIVYIVAHPEEHVPEELVGVRRPCSEMRPRSEPADQRWYGGGVLLVHPRQLSLREEVDAVGLSARMVWRVSLSKVRAHVDAVSVLEEQSGLPPRKPLLGVETEERLEVKLFHPELDVEGRQRDRSAHP